MALPEKDVEDEVLDPGTDQSDIPSVVKCGGQSTCNLQGSQGIGLWLSCWVCAWHHKQRQAQAVSSEILRSVAPVELDAVHPGGFVLLEQWPQHLRGHVRQ